MINERLPSPRLSLDSCGKGPRLRGSDRRPTRSRGECECRCDLSRRSARLHFRLQSVVGSSDVRTIGGALCCVKGHVQETIVSWLTDDMSEAGRSPKSLHIKVMRHTCILYIKKKNDENMPFGQTMKSISYSNKNISQNWPMYSTSTVKYEGWICYAAAGDTRIHGL